MYGATLKIKTFGVMSQGFYNLELVVRYGNRISSEPQCIVICVLSGCTRSFHLTS